MFGYFGRSGGRLVKGKVGGCARCTLRRIVTKGCGWTDRIAVLIDGNRGLGGGSDGWVGRMDLGVMLASSHLLLGITICIFTWFVKIHAARILTNETTQVVGAILCSAIRCPII